MLLFNKNFIERVVNVVVGWNTHRNGRRRRKEVLEERYSSLATLELGKISSIRVLLFSLLKSQHTTTTCYHHRRWWWPSVNTTSLPCVVVRSWMISFPGKISWITIFFSLLVWSMVWKSVAALWQLFHHHVTNIFMWVVGFAILNLFLWLLIN